MTLTRVTAHHFDTAGTGDIFYSMFSQRERIPPSENTMEAYRGLVLKHKKQRKHSMSFFLFL